MPQKTKLIVPELPVAIPRISDKPSMPRIKSVSPLGSKILVEALSAEEVSESSILLRNVKTTDDGLAPQGIIIKLGPSVDPACGLKEGQRVYWNGRGAAIKDPGTPEGRTRAIMEISNIIAIIEEE